MDDAAGPKASELARPQKLVHDCLGEGLGKLLRQNRPRRASASSILAVIASSTDTVEMSVSAHFHAASWSPQPLVVDALVLQCGLELVGIEDGRGQFNRRVHTLTPVEGLGDRNVVSEREAESPTCSVFVFTSRQFVHLRGQLAQPPGVGSDASRGLHRFPTRGERATMGPAAGREDQTASERAFQPEASECS